MTPTNWKLLQIKAIWQLNHKNIIQSKYLHQINSLGTVSPLKQPSEVSTGLQEWAAVEIIMNPALSFLLGILQTFSGGVFWLL